MPKLHLIATAPMGLEAVVARELKLLGYEQVKVENGRVHFEGDLIDICRANLWLRTADRVLIHMGQFTALTFDELFEGTKALPWDEFIPADGEFPVEGRSHKSQLSSVPACQGIVKKAIVEKLKQRHHTEWFAETGPRYVIEITMLNDAAVLTLDTSGAGLHKRGYRKLVSEAPLKETMAAAMVLLSRWRPGRVLYDPFCGSGTIPIEAAMIGWNIAPGLRRTFSAETWPLIAETLWKAARDEAMDLLRDDEPLQIIGSDIDAAAIEIARAAAKSAGLSRELELRVLPVARLQPSESSGCIITNPPYGERVGTGYEAEQALRQLGAVYSKLNHNQWSCFILHPNKQAERFFGRPADKKRKLYNGRIECALLQYWPVR